MLSKRNKVKSGSAGIVRSSSSVSGQSFRKLFLTKLHQQSKNSAADKPFEDQSLANGKVEIIRDISDLARSASLSLEDLRIWQEIALKGTTDFRRSGNSKKSTVNLSWLVGGGAAFSGNCY